MATILPGAVPTDTSKAAASEVSELKTTSLSGPIDMLSPPSDLEDLVAKSVAGYKSVHASSKSLLTRTAIDLNAFDNSVGLRDLVVNGTNSFTLFTQGEVELCERLIAYSNTLKALLNTSLTTATISRTTSAMLATYQKEAENNSGQRMKQATEVVGYIEEIDSRIADAVEVITKLNSQVESMEARLAKMKVGEVLIEALKKLFKLVDDDEGAFIQLAIILGVALSVIKGDFGSLYANKKQLESFITKLKDLQKVLTDVKTDLIKLASGMRDGVQANIVLLNVWKSLAAGAKKLGTLPDNPLNTMEKTAIALAWQDFDKVANRAKITLTDTMNAQSTMRMASNVIPEQQPILSYPETHSQISLLGLAMVHGVAEDLINPVRYQKLAAIGTNAEITTRHFEKVMANATVSGGEHDELKKLLKTFGSNGTEKGLDGLAGDCKAVSNAFDEILKEPFLQNLQVLNPFRPSDPSEPEYLNIRDTVVRYKIKYDVLQTKTRDVVRSLAAYANIQIPLLPIVTLNSDGQGGTAKVSVNSYLTTCQSVINKYEQTAKEVRNEHDLFNKSWELAQTNLDQAIATSKKLAGDLKKEIEEKKREQEKNTLFGVLKILGGIACFALGFLVPFLAPVAWGVGAALLCYGIKDLIENGKIQEAINELQNKYDAANNTAKNLEKLKKPFQTVKDKLDSILAIWNNITQALTNIKGKIDALTSGISDSDKDALWMAFLPGNIQDWTSTKNNCIAYANAIN